MKEKFKTCDDDFRLNVKQSTLLKTVSFLSAIASKHVPKLWLIVAEVWQHVLKLPQHVPKLSLIVAEAWQHVPRVSLMSADERLIVAKLSLIVAKLPLIVARLPLKVADVWLIVVNTPVKAETIILKLKNDLLYSIDEYCLLLVTY